MRIDTTIIASLARGLIGAIPGVNDAVVSVGSDIVPIIKLLRPLQVATTFAQQDQSFFIVFSAQSRTAAAQSPQGPVFAKGLWRLNLSMMFLANWDASPSNTPQAILSLLNPNGAKASLATFHSGLGTFVHLTQRIDTELLLPDDGWALVWDLSATAGAQITIAEVGVIATKLL